MQNIRQFNNKSETVELVQEAGLGVQVYHLQEIADIIFNREVSHSDSCRYI